MPTQRYECSSRSYWSVSGLFKALVSQGVVSSCGRADSVEPKAVRTPVLTA